MQPTVATVLLLPTTYYRVFLLSLHKTPKRNSNSTVTSRCTPQQGTKLLYLLVQTTTGTYSTSLNFPWLAMFHSSSSTSSNPSPPPAYSRSSSLLSSSNSSTSLSPSSLAGSNFASIAHIGVIAQGCAFTIPVSWVLHLSRIAHIGVIAQGYTPEWEIKSFNSFSAQGSESSHMSESSHPCEIKIQVRNNFKIDRTPVR